MPENSRTPLPRRRFGQGLLAAIAALLANQVHRFQWRRLKSDDTHSLREADFYETERPLP